MAAGVEQRLLDDAFQLASLALEQEAQSIMQHAKSQSRGKQEELVSQAQQALLAEEMDLIIQQVVQLRGKQRLQPTIATFTQPSTNTCPRNTLPLQAVCETVQPPVTDSRARLGQQDAPGTAPRLAARRAKPARAAATQLPTPQATPAQGNTVTMQPEAGMGCMELPLMPDIMPPKATNLQGASSMHQPQHNPSTAQHTGTHLHTATSQRQGNSRRPSGLAQEHQEEDGEGQPHGSSDDMDMQVATPELSDLEALGAMEAHEAAMQAMDEQVFSAMQAGSGHAAMPPISAHAAMQGMDGQDHALMQGVLMLPDEFAAWQHSIRMQADVASMMFNVHGSHPYPLDLPISYILDEHMHGSHMLGHGNVPMPPITQHVPTTNLPNQWPVPAWQPHANRHMSGTMQPMQPMMPGLGTLGPPMPPAAPYPGMQPPLPADLPYPRGSFDSLQPPMPPEMPPVVPPHLGQARGSGSLPPLPPDEPHQAQPPMPPIVPHSCRGSKDGAGDSSRANRVAALVAQLHASRAAGKETAPGAGIGLVAAHKAGQAGGSVVPFQAATLANALDDDLESYWKMHASGIASQGQDTGSGADAAAEAAQHAEAEQQSSTSASPQESNLGKVIGSRRDDPRTPQSAQAAVHKLASVAVAGSRTEGQAQVLGPKGRAASGAGLELLAADNTDAPPTHGRKRARVLRSELGMLSTSQPIKEASPSPSKHVQSPNAHPPKRSPRTKSPIRPPVAAQPSASPRNRSETALLSPRALGSSSTREDAKASLPQRGSGVLAGFRQGPASSARAPGSLTNQSVAGTSSAAAAGQQRSAAAGAQPSGSVWTGLSLAHCPLKIALHEGSLLRPASLNQLAQLAPYWSVILRLKYNQEPNVLLVTCNELMKLHEGGSLHVQTLVVGSTAPLPMQPPAKLFRPLALLLAALRCGQTYQPVQVRNGKIVMPPPGWCLPPCLVTGPSHKNVRQGEPVTWDHVLGSTCPLWMVLERYEQAGSWRLIGSGSISAAQACATQCTGFTPVLGVVQAMPPGAWVPTALFLPVAALDLPRTYPHGVAGLSQRQLSAIGNDNRLAIFGLDT